LTALIGPIAARVVADAAGLVAELAREFGDDAGAAQADTLRMRATALAAEDARAYGAAASRLAGSGGQDVELGRALDEAAAAPLRIAETAADVAALAAALQDRVVPEALPDLAGAALLAEGAARVGAHLVAVNLVVQADDERLRRASAAVEAAGAYTSQTIPS
jgi:formiminotetrahydrofolate cyclodeaminase